MEKTTEDNKLILTEDHRYILDGREIPGVTRVIRRFCPAFRVDDWYLERGKAVHSGIELALRGELDPESVDDRIKGRIEAAMLFLAENNLTPVTLEAGMASRSFRFAGTLDCIAVDPKGKQIICDWKGSVDAASQVQLGGYRVLARANGYSPSAVVAVETRDDGSYKAHWTLGRELLRAGSVFLNMLSVANWQDAEKIK